MLVENPDKILCNTTSPHAPPTALIPKPPSTVTGADDSPKALALGWRSAIFTRYLPRGRENKPSQRTPTEEAERSSRDTEGSEGEERRRAFIAKVASIPLPHWPLVRALSETVSIRAAPAPRCHTDLTEYHRTGPSRTYT